MTNRVRIERLEELTVIRQVMRYLPPNLDGTPVIAPPDNERYRYAVPTIVCSVESDVKDQRETDSIGERIALS